MNDKKKSDQWGTFGWAVLLFLFAFIFSAKLPPYLGVLVFLSFFVLSVGLFKKFLFGEEKKAEEKKTEDD